MCSARRVRAVATVAAAFILGWPCVAVRAADGEEAGALLFSGRDLWRNGIFMYGGLLIAPGGFEQDGLMLKLLYSTGAYRYVSRYLGDAQVVGLEGQIQVLPGWRITRGPLATKFFFGFDLQHHRLMPADASNRLAGNAVGLRFAVDFWYKLTADSVVFGDLSLSSIATSNSGRLAYGRHSMREILGGFYLGPELAYFAADGYSHLRVGAHITSMRTNEAEWSAAAGWAGDTDKRTSPYVRLNMTHELVD